MKILDEVKEMTFADGIRDIGFTSEVIKFSIFQAIAIPTSMDEAEMSLVIQHKIVMTHATAVEFSAQLDALLVRVNRKNEDEEEEKD